MSGSSPTCSLPSVGGSTSNYPDTPRQQRSVRASAPIAAGRDSWPRGDPTLPLSSPASPPGLQRVAAVPRGNPTLPLSSPAWPRDCDQRYPRPRRLRSMKLVLVVRLTDFWRFRTRFATARRAFKSWFRNRPTVGWQFRRVKSVCLFTCIPDLR